uniref:BED-type domain-containing protein n=1 Tax=Ascaris lumbricoides TaxID=6252 RepID=A0A9J2QAC6_ASCLU
MPPKSVIQDDIRMKLGRFELVKKKGRSEVWNLFGQVLDTTTGARLPYVACYACKVLYTDTGGGTGNMTRHRCPLGTSYKDSSIGSSTDTNTDLPSQQSFETTVSASGQLSPETGSTYQRESPAPPQSHTTLTAQSSFESSPPFSDFDRRLFCASAVRCCATDLLPPVVFQGDGLRSVIETAISIGRRCRLADRQSLATLIPDTSTLQQLIDGSSKTVLSELKVEVGFAARTTGVSFSAESVAGDDRLTVISANYVGADWRLKRRIISVEPRDQLRAGIERVLKECAVGALRVTIVSEETFTVIEPARISLCICATLNNVRYVPIVHGIMTLASDESHNVADVIASCQKIATTLEKMGLERWTDALSEQRDGRIDYLFYVYELLKFVRECVQHSSVAQYPDLIALVRPVDWSFVDEIRKYLEPFHVMATIFSQKAVINYHMVLPEWFALIHEFSGEEDNASANGDSPSKWLSGVRKATEEKLRAVTSATIGIEHRMATVLNPRLKHLPIICTDLQRIEAYTKIRSMIGPWESRITNVKNEDQLTSETMEGEPPRKRISFLSSLEDRAMIDDELECYLRSQFPAIQTKDVLQFWSTLGQTQFPNLAHLARYLLSIPAACCQHRSQSNIGLPPESLSSLLVLRSSYAHATHLPDASSFSISSVLSAKPVTTKVDA